MQSPKYLPDFIIFDFKNQLKVVIDTVENEELRTKLLRTINSIALSAEIPVATNESEMVEKLDYISRAIRVLNTRSAPKDLATKIQKDHDRMYTREQEPMGMPDFWTSYTNKSVVCHEAAECCVVLMNVILGHIPVNRFPNAVAIAIGLKRILAEIAIELNHSYAAKYARYTALVNGDY